MPWSPTSCCFHCWRSPWSTCCRDRALEYGLLLIATAAGAPFLVKLVETAKGPLGPSAVLLVVLLPVTVVFMPTVVPLAAPDAKVLASAIATPLVLTVLLRFVVGLLVRARRPGWARRLLPVLGRISTVALAVLVLTMVVLNFRAIADIFGEGAILAALLVLVGGFVIGYALGGADPGLRGVLGGLAPRSATSGQPRSWRRRASTTPRTLIMVVVTSLVGFAFLFPAARWLRGHR